MRKRILTVALALVMCLGLTIPAFASETISGNQLYYPGGWGDGPSLTLSGVVGGREVSIQDRSYCYDVEVGGSLVLEMPYPAEMNQSYIMWAAGKYIRPDFTFTEEDLDTWEKLDMWSWELPAVQRKETRKWLRCRPAYLR